MYLSRALAVEPTLTEQARVIPAGERAWRLEIPPGPQGRYRLAQLDDYRKRSRRNFPWQPPVALSLRARASAQVIPGTWGFGFWNDPFSMAIARGIGFRLPALPNAAWFFMASPPNYLSLKDDLPAQGAMAMSFRSPRWPPALLALGAPALPLLLWKPGARLLRRLARRIVHQDAAALELDLTDWHRYALEWQPDRVVYRVDGEPVLESTVVPAGPLGLVMWMDNQYAALTPEGSAGFGTLADEQAEWVELEEVQVVCTQMLSGKRSLR